MGDPGLDGGALGAVRRFESRFERWSPVPRPGWREHADAADAGGLLFDLGAHLIDQALLLFGPARTVYAELDTRRAGVVVDDDSFVALTHASGVRSHLWMSKVASQRAPRFRVLGERGSFVKYGLDGQESAMAAGGIPGAPGWGEEPAERWGLLGEDGSARPIATEPGDYPRFYEPVAAAVQRRCAPAGGPCRCRRRAGGHRRHPPVCRSRRARPDCVIKLMIDRLVCPGDTSVFTAAATSE